MRKKMPIEIIIPQFKSEQHYHSCMYCKKISYEPNAICKKTKIDSHRFPCVNCLQSYRRRFGSMADEMLDIYLNSQQREMVRHVAPDHVSDELDQRDEERKRNQIVRNETLEQLCSGTPGSAGNFPPTLDAAEQAKELERIIDEAETITWEQAQEEIEALKKKEQDF
jgi:hypothetical protein